MRHCVSCGRSIDWNANVCPYCGHDFRITTGPPKPPMSTGIKVLLYLVSFFVSIAGIVIGIVFMMRTDPEEKRVGKICLILGIVSILISVGGAALLYIMVLGFGSDQTVDNWTPTATLSKTSVDGGWRITVVATTHTVGWDDLTVMLGDDTGFTSWAPSSSALAGTGPETEYFQDSYLSGTAVSLSITDLAGNGQVNGGDYFTLTATPYFSATVDYTFRLIHEPTDGMMVSISFSG